QQDKIPVRLNAKRILMVEQIRQHNSIADATLRQQHLRNAAQQLVALRDEETRIKNETIAQCLKATEAGRLVTGLIRDYQKLSLGEMLSLTEQSLGFIAQISDQNADVVALLGKYKGVESTIRNDPYWRALLDEQV